MGREPAGTTTTLTADVSPTVWLVEHPAEQGRDRTTRRMNPVRLGFRPESPGTSGVSVPEDEGVQNPFRDVRLDALDVDVAPDLPLHLAPPPHREGYVFAYLHRVSVSLQRHDGMVDWRHGLDHGRSAALDPFAVTFIVEERDAHLQPLTDIVLPHVVPRSDRLGNVHLPAAGQHPNPLEFELHVVQPVGILDAVGMGRCRCPHS